MDTMDGITLHPDLNEFLQLLNALQVEYLLVGGYALAAHGHVRYTRDIDFWVAPTTENVIRILEVLRRFGFDDVGDSETTLSSADGILTLGREPVKIDLLTNIPGLEFAVARKRRTETSLGGTPVSVICREDLVKAKLASNRLRDLADLEELGVPVALARRETQRKLD